MVIWTRQEKLTFREVLRNSLENRGLVPSIKIKEPYLIEVWLRDEGEYKKYAVLGKKGAILQYFGKKQDLPFNKRIKLERLEQVLSSLNYCVVDYASI